MKFETTPLKDVFLLQPQVFGDRRGFFLESWNQEMFREANTIGSKANVAVIAGHVVEVKAMIERMREMIQNIE